MSRRQAIAALIAATAVAVSAVPAAAAPVGPGAPMRTYPASPVGPVPAQYVPYSCSQAFAGTVTLADGTTKPVMVTAGHCIDDVPYRVEEIRPEVYAPKKSGDELIGYRDQVGAWTVQDSYPGIAEEISAQLDAPDWGTVDINPGVEMTSLSTSENHYGGARSAPRQLTGVRDYRDLGRYEVSADNFGQPICKDGQRSARTCGVQLLRASNSVVHWGLTYESGDSGGINYDPTTGEVIGITSQGIGPLGRSQLADRALQDAYDIPDGQVNERFEIAPPVPVDDDFRTVEQDDEAYNAWAVANGEEPIVDYKKQFSQDLAAAEADLHAGNFEALPHHAEVLPNSAIDAAIQHALGL